MSLSAKKKLRGSIDSSTGAGKNNVDTTLNELRTIFDDKTYVKNIKGWIKEYDSTTYPFINDVFPTIIRENLDGFNSYMLFFFVNDMIKSLKISDALIKVIEDNIMNIIWSAFTYFKVSWNLSNKKNIELMHKTVRQWDSKGTFRNINLKNRIAEMEALMKDTEQLMAISDEQKDIVYKCCCFFAVLFEYIHPPAAVMSTAYELLHHLIYRIDIQQHDIMTTCLAVVFLSGKLWWETHGYVSIKYIVRGYWRCIIDVDLYRIPSIQDTDEGRQHFVKDVFRREGEIVRAWGFDYSLNSLEKTSKLLDDMLKRLNVTEEDSKRRIKAYITSPAYGFSPMNHYIELKLILTAVIIIETHADEGTIALWTISLKVDKDKVHDVVMKMRDHMHAWNNSIIPYLQSLKPKKKHEPSSSSPSISSDRSQFTPPSLMSSAPISGSTTIASLYPVDDDRFNQSFICPLSQQSLLSSSGVSAASPAISLHFAMGARLSNPADIQYKAMGVRLGSSAIHHPSIKAIGNDNHDTMTDHDASPIHVPPPPSPPRPPPRSENQPSYDNHAIMRRKEDADRGVTRDMRPVEVTNVEEKIKRRNREEAEERQRYEQQQREQIHYQQSSQAYVQHDRNYDMGYDDRRPHNNFYEQHRDQVYGDGWDRDIRDQGRNQPRGSCQPTVRQYPDDNGYRYDERHHQSYDQYGAQQVQKRIRYSEDRQVDYYPSNNSHPNHYMERQDIPASQQQPPRPHQMVDPIHEREHRQHDQRRRNQILTYTRIPNTSAYNNTNSVRQPRPRSADIKRNRGSRYSPEDGEVI